MTARSNDGGLRGALALCLSVSSTFDLIFAGLGRSILVPGSTLDVRDDAELSFDGEFFHSIPIFDAMRRTSSGNRDEYLGR